jgi:hypothetical protein
LRWQTALVQHDHAAISPFDRLRYVHSVRRVLGNLLIVAKAAAKNEPSGIDVQGLVGMRVKPCVPIMVVTAIIELYPR